MEIQFIKPNSNSVKIPLVDNGRAIHLHLAEFLVTRYHYPSLISPKLKAIKSLESINAKAYHLKRFLENLDANKHDYLHADFKLVYELLEKLCETHENHNTFNNMYSNIREFYSFLDSKGISHNVHFPDTKTKKHTPSNDQNLLSHTGSRIEIEYEEDPGEKPTQKSSSYRDRIFSKDNADKLYDALYKIDPVYSVIAKVMVQTYLRISNICEMPLHKDKRNQLKLYPELQALDIDRQSLKINAKGQKIYSIPFYKHTSQLIYEDYIEPYFDDRKELFLTKYLHRKNATLLFGSGQRSVPDDVLWLNSKGAPIKPYMIDRAFKKAGLDITPHMCRHTGVTHTLYSFCKLQGIKPTEALASRFTQILQELLGHVSHETTLLYIHTIEDIEVLPTLQYALPQDKDKIDIKLKAFITDQILKDVEEWYSGSTNS